jgi:hypothetical protein
MQPAEQQQLTQRLTQRYGYQPNDAQIQTFKTLSILHPNDPAALRQFDQTMRTAKPKPAPMPGGAMQ